MRRVLLATIAILGLAAGADAHWGTPPNPAPAPAPTNMYGWNKRLIYWWKKDPCGRGACGQNGGAGMGGQSNMPGTLVFPQHPFVRSPRDFFMWGN